jgi:hypothetical protein
MSEDCFEKIVTPRLSRGDHRERRKMIYLAYQSVGTDVNETDIATNQGQGPDDAHARIRLRLNRYLKIIEEEED